MIGLKRPLEQLDEKGRKLRIVSNLYRKIIEDLQKDLLTAPKSQKESIRANILKNGLLLAENEDKEVSHDRRVNPQDYKDMDYFDYL